MIKCIICNDENKFNKKYNILLECLNCHNVFADLKLNYIKLKKIINAENN